MKKINGETILRKLGEAIMLDEERFPPLRERKKKPKSWLKKEKGRPKGRRKRWPRERRSQRRSLRIS